MQPPCHLLLFATLCALLAQTRAVEPAGFTPCQLPDSSVAPATANRAYQLLAPPEMKPGERFPLVVYLHGAGAKGSDNLRPIGEPLPRLLGSAALRAKYPCFILVPQCREGTDAQGRPHNWVNWMGQRENPPALWEQSEPEPGDQLRGAMAALDDVLARHPVDTARIYLTGVSMGGSGSWYWAAREHGRFAAVMTACGLSETAKAPRLTDLPIWAFHGSDDEVAPVGRTRRMVDALRVAGGANVKFTEYAGVGHNLAPQMLAESGVFEWLFSFAKNRPRVVATPRERAPSAGHAPLAGVTATPATGVPAADAEFFEKRIRPVLADHCHECHGEKKQKGGLRLDSRAALLAGGDIGPAVVAGQPDKSLLLTAVRYEDEDLQMPPKKRLSAAQVADLAEWVKRGALWPGESGAVAAKAGGEMQFTPAQKAHWAWQPLRKPAVPGAGHPIDAFIGAKLAAAGLQPAPPADARTFIRRLTFDLTGLPPTPEEVETFAKSGIRNPKSEIERLLASPHYGERYARHWLDVARYADSNGSEVDHAMANAWRYRDYVVRAFNDDLPFDRFVREQLAGDLLPDAALPSTGFLMLGPKALAELDKERLHADIVDEQVDTVSRAFMGLTVGCARCHDHKFDPIGDEDYYALAGIFKSTRSMDFSKRVATWTERPLGDPADLARVEALMKKIADLRSQRDAAGAQNTAAKQKLTLAADAKFLLIEAEQFRRGNVRIETDSLGKGIGVVRTLMEYPDHIEYEFELPAAGDYQLELRYAAKESRPTELIINGNIVEMEAAAEITGDWKPAAQRWFVQGVYAFQKGRNVLAFHRDGPVPLFDKLLIGQRSVEPHGKGVANAPVTPRQETQTKKELDAAITRTQQELEEIPTAMAPFDGPVADAPILVRGNPATPGAITPRGFPRIVSGLPVEKPTAAQSGRIELTQWITQPQHPLTARVIVNRVWLWHFGEGLVRSPDNFGLRGEAPSHPELLDWLAVWFVENGWSMKKLHTLICTSAAYQRTGGSPSNIDPENRLLAHFPRRRLDAEALRDAMLAVSGKLDRTVGGPLMTVMNRTYANGGNAPAGIAQQMHYDTPRRSLYLPIVRSALHDFFAAFDYPDPGMLAGQRASTTVAPQALFLMNSPFVSAQAAAFAARVQTLGDDDAARVRAAYALALNRAPGDEEIAAAVAFVQRSKSWTPFCHALLASNDFLYVQ